ncbi:hypothetical protein V6N13_097066 [Hibiscus sabdariffa]
MIYDYLGEIRTSNPGSTTILMLDNRVFLRMYICLHACKEGYKAGCRPVLSIDGCHLKGYYGGTFLAAVSVDANDIIYPIAYAVVEAETESSWNWFLSLLGVDLEIGSSHNITIVSDKQKGLKEAILEVFPAAEHRNCVRHLCWSTHAGGHKYQVSEGPLNQHAVDLENGTCSCRKWDITGIPCIHDVSMMALNNQRPESFVHTCYKSTTQQQIYSHFIQPMRGPNQWVKDTSCEPVIKPNLRRPPGRPKKKRVRRTTTLSSPLVMPTTSASPNVMTISSSPPVMPTTSASPQISPFVFIPTPGNGMRVRWMQSSHEDVNGGQQLSQSSTITQNSQEESNPSVPAKKPRMV